MFQKSILISNKYFVCKGVEWDDKSRGKHDGSCIENGKLVKYFNCLAGAGSFVKPLKLCLPKSLKEALVERYVALDAPIVSCPDFSLPGMFAMTVSGSQKPIELVGEKKMRYNYSVYYTTK